MPTIELSKEQINLILRLLLERRDDIDGIIKEEQDRLEAETIRDMLIERREIDNVIRELQYYSKPTIEDIVGCEDD